MSVYESMCNVWQFISIKLPGLLLRGQVRRLAVRSILAYSLPYSTSIMTESLGSGSYTSMTLLLCESQLDSSSYTPPQVGSSPSTFAKCLALMLGKALVNMSAVMLSVGQ